jgi:acyl carrier protein
MGLDGIELVMEVEDEFGIKILDLEAEQIRTVGDLTRTVQRKLGIEPRAIPVGEPEVCLPAAAFFRLQRAWGTHPVAADHRLRPGTPLAPLTRGIRGRWARARLWKLGRRAGVRLPPLRMDPSTGAIMLMLVGAATAASVYGALLTGSATVALMPLVLSGVAALCAIRLARRFPSGVVTVGDAIRACEQPTVYHGSGQELSELERKIIAIVGEQLAYDPEFITLESRFVEDLDMD